MAVLDIVTYPDERLKTKAEPVSKVDEAIQKLIDDMAETMYAAPGIGLAGNQVGVLKRIAVIDAEYTEGKPNLIVLINPKIVTREEEIVWEEGCLSFPEVREDVCRFRKIRVKALDRTGEPFEIDAEDLLAVAIQHEIDHLDGIVFIDHVSFLKRRIIHRQMVKNKKTG